MKKVIEVFRTVGWDNTSLIILEKTGVYYTAQCGGVTCTHPEAEGYVINLGAFADDFDDCSYGCCYIPENPHRRMDLANDFNEYCEKGTRNWIYQISFDFERIEETQEGWLPVVLNGELDGMKLNNVKGIIHSGNCD